MEENRCLEVVYWPAWFAHNILSLQVNFFFLLNIVRVLVSKMRETQEAESHMYLKAVRATLILVPLLGIQFVVFPWRPSNKLLGKIYDYLMHSLIHFQVGKPTVHSLSYLMQGEPLSGAHQWWEGCVWSRGDTAPLSFSLPDLIFWTLNLRKEMRSMSFESTSLWGQTCQGLTEPLRSAEERATPRVLVTCPSRPLPSILKATFFFSFMEGSFKGQHNQCQ